MNSKLWKLQLNDFWKGLIVVVLTAVLTVVYQSVSQGGLTVDYRAVLTTAMTAGIAYVLKNLGTGEGGKILTDKVPDGK